VWRKWELAARIWLWDLNGKSSHGKTKRSGRINSSQRNGVKDRSALNSFCTENSGSYSAQGNEALNCMSVGSYLSCKINHICSTMLQYLSIFFIKTNTHFVNNFITWQIVSTLNSGHHQAMTQEYERIQKLNAVILSFLRQKYFKNIWKFIRKNYYKTD